MFIPPPSLPCHRATRESSPLRRREQQPPPDWREVRVPDKRPLCHYFSIGACHFGAVCRNRHDRELRPDEPQAESPQVSTPTKQHKRRR